MRSGCALPQRCLLCRVPFQQVKEVVLSVRVLISVISTINSNYLLAASIMPRSVHKGDEGRLTRVSGDFNEDRVYIDLFSSGQRLSFEAGTGGTSSYSC